MISGCQPTNRRNLTTLSLLAFSQLLWYPSPRRACAAKLEYDRQVLLFGDRGQEILSGQKVAVIGAGGAGSLINEYLARLGVGHIIAVDFDRLDPTNYPRVVGARPRDLKPRFRSRLLARLLRWQPSPKVAIAKRVAREANPSIRYEAIVGDVTEPAVAERLVDCDAIFLAADSMQARLVANAICHQYLIPTWQVGAKVTNDPTGAIQDVFSVIRRLIPGESCLWCNELVNPYTARGGGCISRTKCRAAVRGRRSCAKCNHPQRCGLCPRRRPVPLHVSGSSRVVRGYSLAEVSTQH